jgi:16S rRNA (cytosine967-C5)-methyltransferase
MPSQNTKEDTKEVPGLAARTAAADILDAVLRSKRPLDEQLEATDLTVLPDRDRALVRNIVATTLRRLGTIRYLLAERLERGLPPEAPRTETAMLVGATQILFLDVPDHAAVDLSVRIARADRYATHYAKLTNAVLRRLALDGKERLATLDTVMLDTPEWLMQRWIAAYGEPLARSIATAHAHEAALDISVKSDPQGWAEKLNGRVLATGTIRTIAHGQVPQLPGFDDGEWWVQDAAAAIPAKLLGDVRGKSVADLCAAPGGKTAQLGAAGAKVTAVDRSAPRLKRLAENLARLKFEAETITADAAQWKHEPFDAVLVDAPCSSTGTIRRHPDIPWLKTENDIAKLIALQTRLLDHAVTLVKPGGMLVYCTCSLEPQEGEQAIAALLERNPGLKRSPVLPAEVGGLAEIVTPEGAIRSLPCHLPYPEPQMSGLDGFYAARIIRV